MSQTSFLCQHMLRDAVKALIYNLTLLFFSFLHFWIFWFFRVQKPDQMVQAKNATHNMQLAFCTGGLFNMAGSLGKEFHGLLVTLHGCILTIMKAKEGTNWLLA
jgi:hypothetical protein